MGETILRRIIYTCIYVCNVYIFIMEITVGGRDDGTPAFTSFIFIFCKFLRKIGTKNSWIISGMLFVNIANCILGFDVCVSSLFITVSYFHPVLSKVELILNE